MAQAYQAAGAGAGDGWQCSQCVKGGRTPAIPGLYEQRGKCGGRFSDTLSESERRVSWCGFNARVD